MLAGSRKAVSHACELLRPLGGPTPNGSFSLDSRGRPGSRRDVVPWAIRDRAEAQAPSGLMSECWPGATIDARAGDTLTTRVPASQSARLRRSAVKRAAA